MDPFIADASVMQVLQVFGISLQGHGVILNSFVEKPHSHIAISAVGIAFAVGRVEFDFFSEVFDSFSELLHLTVDQSNVGVGDGVFRI